VVVLTLAESSSDQTGHGRFGEPLATVCLYGRDVRRRDLKGALGYYRRALESGLTLLRLVRRHRIRVAHLNYGMPEYAPLLTWLKLLRVPAVLTLRGSDVHEMEPATPEAADMNAVVEAATQVTAVSEGLLEIALDRLPAAHGKAQTVHNVAPLDVWDAAAAVPIDTGRDTDVLFVGNLQAVKGPDFLIEVFARVVQRRPRTSLSIVGSGDMEAELRETVARLGLDTNVRFLGRRSRRDIPGYLRRARVLAIPSRGEGLPLVAVEAQLYGTPVVGTAVGGLPEAVVSGQTGTIVPFGDTRAFADALLSLLDDGVKWKRKSGQARRWALRAFDPAIAVERYLELYGELVPDAVPIAS
jgi:glycosyltransferase involved in cell wall biosynthesis